MITVYCKFHLVYSNRVTTARGFDDLYLELERGSEPLITAPIYYIDTIKQTTETANPEIGGGTNQITVTLCGKECPQGRFLTKCGSEGKKNASA